MSKFLVLFFYFFSVTIATGCVSQNNFSNDFPLVQVHGNKLVDASGQKRVFKGVSIAGPEKLHVEGRWTRKLFDQVKVYGANIVRIPVHPNAWRTWGAKAYLSLLDDAVVWANQLGIYLIIDWHVIGNIIDNKYPHSRYETSIIETKEFWDLVSKRYSGQSAVMAYELYNEPSHILWQDLHPLYIELIELIRKNDPLTISLVSGPDWAYDLTNVSKMPVNMSQVAYSVHPYPQKTKGSYLDSWNRNFGFLSDRYPIIITEFGFASKEEGSQIPYILNGDYPELLTQYMSERDMSWIAWCFDPDWKPSLIFNWNGELSISGSFIESRLYK